MNIIDRLREVVKNHYRSRLKNREFTIIANNCNGTFLYYDLKLKYRTPTVNLWIPPADYVRLCSNLHHYLNLELSFTTEEGVNYPIGVLDDVKIYFMHYHSDSEAKEKWDERKRRVNYNNLFFLMTERDKCTYKDLQDFDKLPNANKVVITHKRYPEIKSSYKISKLSDKNEVGLIYKYYIGKLFLTRHMYNFDFIGWLNSAVK